MQKLNKSKFSCVSSSVCCDICLVRHYCSVWTLVWDLSAIRLKCPNCYRETREEHVRYCPFCGHCILDFPLEWKVDPKYPKEKLNEDTT